MYFFYVLLLMLSHTIPMERWWLVIWIGKFIVKALIEMCVVGVVGMACYKMLCYIDKHTHKMENERHNEKTVSEWTPEHFSSNHRILTLSFSFIPRERYTGTWLYKIIDRRSMLKSVQNDRTIMTKYNIKRCRGKR